MKYLIFLVLYITIELFFRDYAINLLGQTHVFSFEIETFELLGRTLSSLGFTLFFAPYFLNKFKNKKQKTFFIVALFSTVYFLLYLIMNNIHVFTNEEQRENAYYTNLFKQGVSYMPRINEDLPFTGEGEEDLYNTFYSLSSFLYFGNSTIQSHVEQYEDTYTETVAQNRISEEDLKLGLAWLTSYASHNNFLFYRAFAVQYGNYRQQQNFVDNMRYYGVLFALHKYGDTTFEDIYDLDLGQPLPNHRRHPQIVRKIHELNEAYENNEHDLSEDRSRRASTDANPVFDLAEELLVLFERHHSRENDQLLEALLETRALRNTEIYNDYKIGSRRNRNAFKLEDFTEDSLFDFFKKHIKAAYSSRFEEALDNLLVSDLTHEEIIYIKTVWMFNNTYDFLTDHRVNEILGRNELLLEPRIYAQRYIENGSYKPSDTQFFKYEEIAKDIRSFYIFMNYDSYFFYPDMEMVDDSYYEFLKEYFYEKQNDLIKESKDNYKDNLKMVLIPPLILFLLNIALFLNISNLIIYLFRNIVPEDYKKYVQALIFILLLGFVGSNKGINHETQEEFFNIYAKETMHIENHKIFIVKWFIKKNNFFDAYFNLDYNPVQTLSDYIIYFKSKIALQSEDNQKDKFEAEIHLYRLQLFEEDLHEFSLLY